jgi:vancomycin resistance protein YoaR
MAQRDLPANRALQGDHAFTPQVDESREPRQHRANRRLGGWWWKLPLVAVMLMVGASAAGTFWIDRAYAERVYPNVAVQDVHVGGKTRADMQQAVEASFAAFRQSPVSLRFGDASWQPSLVDLGVTLDWDHAFEQALAVGHTGSRTDKLLQIARMAQQDTNVQVPVVVDRAKLASYLRHVAAEIDREPRDANVTLEHGTVHMTPSADGRMVLLSETVNTVVDSLQQLQPQDVAIQTRAVQPQITSERAAEVKRDIETMIGSPLELVAKGRSFALSPETLTEFVTIERGGKGTLNAQLDQRKLEAVLRDITAEVGKLPVEPRVTWNNGELEIFQEGTSGYGVAIEQAMTMIDAAVRTASRRIELPMSDVQPQVRPETLASLGIKELVGEGKSFFTGSAAYRVTNIKAGVKLIHGTLVAPGGEFSFNDTVGEKLDASKGFVPGSAIVNNRKQVEYGGGICQDSTTVYRAAFYAGLPITERFSHSARLHFYEIGETIGMDAAIFTGTGPDLRFINDTGHWMLIQGEVDPEDASVTFSLYGTKVAGRTVERSKPVVVNRGGGAMSVTVTRIVKQDGEVVRTEKFPTYFKPLQEPEENER